MLMPLWFFQVSGRFHCCDTQTHPESRQLDRWVLNIRRTITGIKIIISDKISGEMKNWIYKMSQFVKTRETEQEVKSQNESQRGERHWTLIWIGGFEKKIQKKTKNAAIIHDGINAFLQKNGLDVHKFQKWQNAVCMWKDDSPSSTYVAAHIYRKPSLWSTCGQWLWKHKRKHVSC